MKVIQPPRTITVELTEKEATVLCALVGGIPFNFDTEAGTVIHAFYNILDSNLVGREESFVDYFEGKVTIKR